MSVAIGERLRRERQSRSLSLEEVSQATYMRVHYLVALETGNLETIPSQAQARGFLRAYADFLGMNSEALLLELDQEETNIPPQVTAVIAEPSQPVEASEGQIQNLFQEIGQILKTQRQLLGLSVDDVSRHTHLRIANLQLIENGKFDELPSPVQARGMLNNYASFIGLDPEPVLLKFAEALQVRLAARQAKAAAQARPVFKPVPAKTDWSVRRIITRETIFTLLISLLLIVFMVWGIVSILEARQKDQPVPLPPSIADVLLATATITETPTPEPPTATPPEAPLFIVQDTPALEAEVTLGATQAGTVQVYVTIRQRAWMRVTVDGKVEFDGRVLPGSAYQYAGKEQVEILTGNGAAVQVFFQQQDLGPMGNYGQVVDQVFTLQGILLPTETITPTPTETPPTSSTPTSTQSAGG